MRARGVVLVALIAGAALGVVLGCEAILGIDDIKLSPAGDACWDAKGFAGRGCFQPSAACKPTTYEEILNTCTQARCEYFDNEARLSAALTADGGLPSLPPPSSGAGGAGGGGTQTGAGGAVGAGGAGGAGVGTGTGGGGTGTACSSLPGNRVYITGSNAVKPLLTQLGPMLAPPNPGDSGIRLIYQAKSSCLGVEAMLDNVRIEGTASYWVSSDMVEHSCDLEPGGDAVDIGTSDVFASTCRTLPNGLPSTIQDHQGPIQAMTFIVPNGSEQKVISQQAAYLVYGFGGDPAVDPWADSNLILRRDSQSGTQRMISGAIDVPADRWQGRQMANTTEMKNEVKATIGGDALKTIGIFDVINGDPERVALKVLAFQAKGQRCGFWPDSGAGFADRDKINVRDGHYPIWGPLHLFIRQDANGNPSNPDARQVVDYISGTQTLPGDDAIQFLTFLAQGSLVPQCAMQVRRKAELGPLEPFAPETSCACRFEAITTSNTSCVACTDSSMCPQGAPRCNYGYCEPQ